MQRACSDAWEKEQAALIGGAGYPAPRSFALRVIGYTQCAGAWPLRRARHRFVLDGCGVEDIGPLLGHRVHWSGDLSQTEAVAEVNPPKPNSCWVLTALVVRYHVAGLHYRATYPDAMATCRGLAIAHEQDVMQAAGAAWPGT